MKRKIDSELGSHRYKVQRMRDSEESMTVEHVTDFDDTARFGRKLIFLITNARPRSRNGIFLQGR